MRKFNRSFITPVILLFALMLGACQAVAMTVAEEPPEILVIEALEQAHNTRNVDAIVALYADDGVEKNEKGIFVGPESIRDFYNQAVLKVKVDNTHFQIDGNKILYDCIMLVEGEPVGAAKYEAVVKNGKIKSNIFVGNFPIN